MNKNNTPREFTRNEYRAIKSLVTEMCANYDKTYNECMISDKRCYMLNTCYTGSYCKYFRKAVLPLDPILEHQINNNSVQSFPDNHNNGEYKHCEACGLPFSPIIGNEKYCTVRCKKAGDMIKKRESKRKKQRIRQKKYA